MNVLYVYDGDWPRGATRVAKETKAIAEQHAVTLICRNESRDPRVDQESWMAVRRLPAFGPRLLNKAINFPYFFNPVWIWHMFRIARRSKADCVVVADLPLAPTALFVARVLRLPVYYDLAEIYPEFIWSRWELGEMRWSDYLVRNGYVADFLEKFVVTRMDGMFAVSEESKARLVGKGVPPERITLVGNTPEEPDSYLGTGAPPPEMAPFADRPVLLFVGILIGDRGVETAIRAMATLRVQRPDAVLVIVGDGPDRPRLEELTAELKLGESVAFLGWQPHESLPDFYGAGDIGLLPFHDGRHIRLTLANKLFDYMAAGLALIATDLPPMRRVVEDCGSGLVIPPEDPEALARAAAEILADPGRAAELGASGRAAILDRYSWSHDAERLLAALEA